jgi:hypothetical protein
MELKFIRMSTRDTLIQQLMKQPEQVLLEMQHHLDSLVKHDAHNGDGNGSKGGTSAWPEKYFERTAGAFAGEPLERPPQLPFEKREEW